MSQVCPSPSPNLYPTKSLQVTYPTIISCFPQMRLEVASQKSEVEPERSGAREGEAEQTPKEEDVELTDDEMAVIQNLKANSPIDLNELKGQTGLSNKKWDKAIKGLTKNNLAKVEKTDAGLSVLLV
jgi:hypothetical protein